MTAADPPALERTRWDVVVLAIGAGLLAAFQIGKIPAALPELRVELVIGFVAAGWIASILSVTSALFGVTAGLLSDWFGHRRLLLANLGIMAIGSGLGGIAGDAGWLMASRVLEGVAFLGLMVSVPSLMLQAATARQQPFVLGLWSARMPVGMALMIAVSPALLIEIGWRGIWHVNAGLSLLLLATIAVRSRGLPPLARRRGADPGRDLKLALTRPGPWLLGACFMTYAAIWMAVMTWLPTFLIETAGYSLAAAAGVSALIVVCNAPSNILAGWLAQRGIGTWPMVAFPALVMGVLGALLFSDLVGDAAKVPIAMGMSFAGGFLPGAVIVAVPRHAPSPAQVGAVNGIIMQGSNIGQLVGPPVLALVVARSGGWDNAGWMVLLIALIGAGLALAVRLIEERDERAQPA